MAERPVESSLVDVKMRIRIPHHGEDETCSFNFQGNIRRAKRRVVLASFSFAPTGVEPSNA
jgi:hypothetical protein